jgi:hypothetical protein
MKATSGQGLRVAMHNKDHAAFHRLMKEVLAFMNMAPSEEPSGTTYELTFNSRDTLYFVSSTEGILDIVADAGPLLNRTAHEVLLGLLALNRPPFSVNLDKATGKVTVWFQQTLDRVTESDINELIQPFLDRIAEVQAILNDKNQSPGSEASRTSFTHARLIGRINNN